MLPVVPLNVLDPIPGIEFFPTPVLLLDEDEDDDEPYA